MTITTIYSNTLSALALMVARSLDDCVSGVVTGTSTNTTVVSNTLLKPDDFYIGQQCHFYAGTHLGQTREITDSALVNTVLTFSPAVVNICDTTDYYMLTKKFTYDQYKDAINLAIDKAKERYLLNKVTTSVTQVDDTYEYAVPDGYRYISKIIPENTVDGDDYYELSAINSNDWDIVKDPTAPVIRFTYEYKTGVHFEITGQSVQPTLSTDSAVCYMPTTYVVQMAKAILMSSKPEYEKLIGPNMQLADRELQLITTPVLPGSKSVFEL